MPNLSLLRKYKDVFMKLKAIEKGRVITYKKLSDLCNVNNPRLIGKIIHNNPDTQKYPCHRVVRSDRTLAGGYAFGGRVEQRSKLEDEGIVFEKNKIPLKYFI